MSSSSRVSSNGTFDFALLRFVDELLVVGDDALGDGLTDGVQLGGVASSANIDAHIEILEALEAEKQDGLPHLHTESCGLEEIDGRAVDPHDALALADAGDSDRVLLAAEGLNELSLAGHNL